MDVHDQLTHLEATLHGAKAMPMSSSCLVNRAEMLEVIGRLRAAIPATLDHADAVLAERDAILAAGREQADCIVQDGRDERERLIAQSDVLTAATVRANAMTAQARAEATRLLTEADGYIDRKLAEFEVILGQLGSQVNNGRLRLTYRREADLSHFQGKPQAAARQAPLDTPKNTPNNTSHVMSRAAEPSDEAPSEVLVESGASADAGAGGRQGPAAGGLSL